MQRTVRFGCIAFTAIVLSSAISKPVAADAAASAYLGGLSAVQWNAPPLKSKRLKVTLRFNLARNGSVSLVRVEKTSGDASFDDSAIQAVRRASPFPPPPKSFPIGDIRMVLEPTQPVPPKSVSKKRPDQEI
jgi:TonB family protein